LRDSDKEHAIAPNFRGAGVPTYGVQSLLTDQHKYLAPEIRYRRSQKVAEGKVKLVTSNRVTSLSKPELIALLLYVPGPQGRIGEPTLGWTRLMKIVFLLYEEAKMKELKGKGSFVPFRFGPFDSEVFDAVEALKTLGIVKTEMEPRLDLGDQVELKTDDKTTFGLTDQGIAKVRRLVENISPDLYRTLSNYKTLYSRKPLTEILHYVYNKYPSYAVRSEVVQSV
jgi:hypothetical protein